MGNLSPLYFHESCQGTIQSYYRYTVLRLNSRNVPLQLAVVGVMVAVVLDILPSFHNSFGHSVEKSDGVYPSRLRAVSVMVNLE